MRYIVTLIASLFLLSGCNNDLSFKIEFDNTQNLPVGALIKHKQDTIGKVEKIDYQDNGQTLVTVSIAENYRSMANNSALFFINKDPETQTTIIDVVEKSDSENKAIKDGDTIIGSNKFDGMAQQLQNQFNNALRSFSSSINESWNDWKEKSLDKQISYLEKELDKILVEFNHLSEDTKKQLETHIIPQLKKQLEHLRKKLESLGRESELDSIQRKMKDVDDLVAV